MKINFILPGLGSSGGIEVVEKYVEIMNKNGNDAVIYSYIINPNLHRYNNSLMNLIHQIYCTIKSIFILISGKKKSYKWVLKIDNKSIRNADFTIATMWATAFQVNDLSPDCGKKIYFIQGFEIWDNKDLGLKSYTLPLKKIVISSWINYKLYQELGLGPFPIVYNGMDTKIYKKDICNKSNGSEIKLLMLNHKMPQKGVANGLLVFEKIRDNYVNCQLRMFGMCNHLNLPDYVEYYQNPTKEKIIELYTSSDIFIFPSLEEGWGLAPLEAMACGCAVVGSNTGFVLDLGSHEKNMMISEVGDINEMTLNIEKLIKNKELMKSIKEKGINTTRDLDWKKSYEQFLLILLEELK